MNFEKIINYFRRLGQTIRTKFSGSRSKEEINLLKKGKLRLDLSGIVSKHGSRLRMG